MSPQISVAALLSITLASCGTLSNSHWAFAPGPSLSEDAALDDALKDALQGFLAELRRGSLGDHYVEPAEQSRHAFFYRSVLRGARDARAVVLKSHPIGNGRSRITVAFGEGARDALSLARIIEFDAIPNGGTFRFACPYPDRTRELERSAIGSVTFRFRGELDEARASAFVRLKERLESMLGREPVALEYDCFEGLDALLKAHGLVHDASKCNFLQHDLGFLTDDGRRFATGTGDASYAFGYVRDFLAAHHEETFTPYLNGVAAYYGGYGLSGDSVDVLARQFREELARRPGIDFLEEFKKGRGSSVERHFSHYVMCAFLCREIVARRGEAAAIALAGCGASDELFFRGLERELGVTPSNFHATIVRLIGAARPEESDTRPPHSHPW